MVQVGRDFKDYLFPAPLLQALTTSTRPGSFCTINAKMNSELSNILLHRISQPLSYWLLRCNNMLSSHRTPSFQLSHLELVTVSKRVGAG